MSYEYHKWHELNRQISELQIQRDNIMRQMKVSLKERYEKHIGGNIKVNVGMSQWQKGDFELELWDIHTGYNAFRDRVITNETPHEITYNDLGAIKETYNAVDVSVPCDSRKNKVTIYGSQFLLKKPNLGALSDLEVFVE